MYITTQLNTIFFKNHEYFKIKLRCSQHLNIINYTITRYISILITMIVVSSVSVVYIVGTMVIWENLLQFENF